MDTIRRSRVWIVHDQLTRTSQSHLGRARFDFSDAELFGDVCFILDQEYSVPDSPSIVQQIRSSLKDYDPAKDYIVLVGSPVMMGTVATIAAEYGRGQVRFLRWIKNEARYSPVLIDTRSC